MYNHYRDILERIDEPPKWFDEFGVPRYVAFSPEHLANFSAAEAALAEISCQSCGRRFRVALTDAFPAKGLALSDEIRLRRIHYGDPPNLDCCGSGPTMNSVMHEVIEYWFRNYELSLQWRRDSAFEGQVAKPPLNPADTVAEILASIQSGSDAILVNCTSGQNRHHLAGQTTAAILDRGRVLILHSDLVAAHKILEGLVPKADIGHWHEDRKVTRCSFSDFLLTDVATIKAIIILAGPPARNASKRENLAEVSDRLAKLNGTIKIEFVLPHSHRMIFAPTQSIDAGRIEEPTGRTPESPT
jgi:hypothetical protein